MNTVKNWKSQFLGWLKEICPGDDLERYCQILDDSNPPGDMSVRFFSKNYYYTINVHTKSGEASYLGAFVGCRKPRAGETWHRGNDLPDGKFSKETWDKIKHAMIRYELVKVIKKQEGLPDVK